MSQQYSVAIIGCGSIGALKPDEFDRPGGDEVLTHAHAFWQHPRIQKSILFVDVNIDKAKRAALKWTTGCSFPTSAFISYDNWKARKLYTDIIVVAAPTSHHRTILLESLDHTPRLVITEKPFCSTLEEAEEANGRAAAAGIPVLVNYIRRFDPVASAYFDRLRRGDYGRIQSARCLYGRGLKRDGCHAVDIFRSVLGDCRGIHYNRAGIVDNVEPGDGTYTVHMAFERCADVSLVGSDSRCWGAFEIEFVTEAGIIAFPKWGLLASTRRAQAEDTFGQYKALGWPAQLEETGLKKAMLYVADNCVKFLDSEELLKCTAADAVRVHEILRHIGNE